VSIILTSCVTRSKLEEQIPKLEAFFKRCNFPREEEEGDDIDNNGEYWEFLDPEKLDNWSLHMIPFKNLICFSYKFKNNDTYYSISYDEKIKDIALYRANVIKVHCVTAQTGKPEVEQFHFTIILTPRKFPSP